MRFQQKRNTFNGGSVGAFTALRQSLLDQRADVREQADTPARGALAAEIIAKPFAVGRLREHSRECKLPNTARSCK
jgi:hypothetical protein